MVSSLESLTPKEQAELLLQLKKATKSAEVDFAREEAVKEFRGSFWWAFSNVLCPEQYKWFIEDSELHKSLCLKAQEGSETYPLSLFLVPRQGLKTTLLTEFHTVWLLVQEQVKIGELMGRPFVKPGNALRIALISETEPNAKRMLANVKSVFLRNKLFRELFPDYCPEATGVYGNANGFRLPNAPDLMDEKDMSVECGGTNTRLTSRHYDWAKLDDLISYQSSRTPEIIENAKYWYENSRYLFDSEDLRWEFIIGTRYDAGDVYGDLVQRGSGHKDEAFETRVAHRPYQRSALESNGRPSYDGQSIWPQKWSTEGLLKEFKDDPYVFSCQRMNEPTARGRAMFSWDMVQSSIVESAEFTPFWIEKDSKLDLGRACIFAAFDAARGDSTTNDNTVLLIGAYDWNDTLWVMDGYVGKYSTDEALDIIYHECATKKVLKFALERTGGQYLWENLIRRDARAKNVYVPLDPQERVSTVSKVMRAEVIVPALRDGRLKLVKSGLQRLVYRGNGTVLDKITHEMKLFPSKTVADDTVDCLADLLIVGFRARNPDAKPHVRHDPYKGLHYGGQTDYAKLYERKPRKY